MQAALTKSQANDAAKKGDLIFALKKIGRIPKNFDSAALVPLLENKNEEARVLAIKNLAKLSNVDFLEKFFSIAKNDESTAARAEAASAIGRMRNERAIPVLMEILKDDDPKVVCQAARGLLVFKGNGKVDGALRALASHKNETVKSIIQKNYFDSAKKTKADENFEKKREPFFPNFLRDAIVNADTLRALALVPDESVHLTFTSPPYYNARDYSIYKSYDEYLDFLEKVFVETRRVTKEGRFLIVNTSPIIIPRVGRNYSSHRYPIPFDLHARIVKNGWEFIDDIVWEKPEYSVKNRVAGFAQHRKPLAYKPNAVTEYLMVYRKKTEKLLDWNMRRYDDGAIETSKVKGDFETTNVWKICPKSDKIHSAVFPEELCERVIKYYSYKGDLVFDPFAGSGTVGRAAKKLERNFFLTEKDKKYFDYIKTLMKDGDLFDENETKFLSLEKFKESAKINSEGTK